MSAYRLVERVPSARDYNRVRAAAGLSTKNPVAAEIGLANTVFGVCVELDGEVVGIGRIVGDGVLFFEIVDIAVSPEETSPWQRYIYLYYRWRKSLSSKLGRKVWTHIGTEDVSMPASVRT